MWLMLSQVDNSSAKCCVWAEDKFFNMFASFARFLPVLPIYGDNKSLKPSLEKKSRLGTQFVWDWWYKISTRLCRRCC